MVNPGGPSRACKECKDRRVKCDLTQPSCGQCVRLKKTCSGPKTERDIFIVDQTNKVQRNADKAKSTKSKSSKQSYSSASSDSDLFSLMSGSPEAFAHLFTTQSPSIASQKSSTSLRRHQAYEIRLPRELRISYEQPAIQFYYDTMVKSPSATQFLNQHLSMWSTLYANASADSPVRQAAYALSLAAFASRVNVREIGEHARDLYGKALASTGAALNNPEKSNTNDVLFSVLLLSDYEQTASMDLSSDGRQDSNLRNYNNHIKGAVGLVSRRGSSELYDEDTAKLFKAVRLRVVLDSVVKTEEIPGAVDESFYEYDIEDDAENCLQPLYKTSLALPRLRHRATAALRAADVALAANEPVDIELLEQLILDAQNVDKRLQNWLNQLPPAFRYCSIACLSSEPEDPEIEPIWPGMVHIYSNCFIASFLNNYRIMRIYLQELIAKCAARLGTEDVLDRETRQGQVLYILRQMVDEICGTVPFLCGEDIPGMPIFMGGHLPPASVGSWLNVRSLYVASQVECVPRAQKRWIYGRLMAIANEHGYKIASDIGKEASPEPEERPSLVELPYQQRLMGR